MAEQVDAADLKSVGRKAVPVRFRPSAPIWRGLANFLLTLDFYGLQRVRIFDTKYALPLIIFELIRINSSFFSDYKLQAFLNWRLFLM